MGLIFYDLIHVNALLTDLSSRFISIDRIEIVKATLFGIANNRN